MFIVLIAYIQKAVLSCDRINVAFLSSPNQNQLSTHHMNPPTIYILQYNTYYKQKEG